MIEQLVGQIEARYADLSAQLSDPEVVADNRRRAEAGRAFAHIEPAARTVGQHHARMAGEFPGDHQLLGIAARQQRRHLLPDAVEADGRADRADGSGALEPEDGRGSGRRGIVALALQEVGAVHRRRGDVDDHLAWAGGRVGDLLPRHDVGTARLAHGDRVHHDSEPGL